MIGVERFLTSRESSQLRKLRSPSSSWLKQMRGEGESSAQDPEASTTQVAASTLSASALPTEEATAKEVKPLLMEDR